MSEFMPEITITGEQLKAARMMLRMDQKQFAFTCHVSVGMVRRMEKTKGPIANDEVILKAIQHALAENGIELISAGYYEGSGGPGVRIKNESEMARNVVDMDEVTDAYLEKKMPPEQTA